MIDFEKLGAFYLGRGVDAGSGKPGADPVLYDSRDLVTHAVCVGMTGSGKTGLGVVLLEEAAIDGIPAIIIDPKGDLGNLKLTFPALRGEEFRPWIDPDAARRAGVGAEDFAAAEAARWKDGLDASGQDGARIARLREAAEFTIYTPGSSSGVPISILRSFAAPPVALRQDDDLLRERAQSAVTGLLGMIGTTADPLQGREHILLATLLLSAWKAGRDLDLPGFIQAIQTPSFSRVGMLDLETFFPARARFALAMQVNNLLAAPGFEAWLDGVPLDAGELLYTKEGRPRHAIISIAHLGDAERMLFVTLLLNEVVAWMRAQSGTTSLRAIVYMDEMLGYFPPVANPPSKAPLLTLMKQARAFGVGMVLATQNPFDLDYKGLANAGTWFIGRLQTERDKARLLDGLEGALGSTPGKAFDRAETERTLAGLGKRTFYLHNVHEDRPLVFQTRWSMSYLAGPLTREQIRRLNDEPGTTAVRSSEAVRTATDGAAGTSGTGTAAGTDAAPMLPPDVPQWFLPIRSPRPAGSALVYSPALIGVATVAFPDAASGSESEAATAWLLPLEEAPGGPDWSAAARADLTLEDLERTASAGASFEPLPAEATRAKSYERWAKAFTDHAARTARLDLVRSAALEEISRAGESERDFRIRLRDLARERRDQEKERLRAKFAPRLAKLEEQIRRAGERRDREAEQAAQQKVQSAISIGATVLGALFGRKKVSVTTLGRATTAARGIGRAAKESGDVARAGENVEIAEQRLSDLNAELESDLAALDTAFDPMTEKLEPVVVRAKKAGVTVRLVGLAWAPGWRDALGATVPAWS